MTGRPAVFSRQSPRMWMKHHYYLPRQARDVSILERDRIAKPRRRRVLGWLARVCVCVHCAAGQHDLPPKSLRQCDYHRRGGLRFLPGAGRHAVQVPGWLPILLQAPAWLQPHSNDGVPTRLQGDMRCGVRQGEAGARAADATCARGHAGYDDQLKHLCKPDQIIQAVG